MIIVHAPLKRDYIVSLLDQKTIEGIYFAYDRRDKMKLYFRVEGNINDAIKIAKSTIKKSEFGMALYFMVEAAT
jgi:hypothetical protein